MRKIFFSVLLALIVSIVAGPSFATDLMDVYDKALTSDPVFQEAWSTRLSDQEALPQSIAGLLPNLSASGSSAGNYINIYRAPAIEGAPIGSKNPQIFISRFHSDIYSLNLSQTLINFSSWMRVRAASAKSKGADATYAAATQDLMIRVAKAYFNVLLAEDQLIYTQAQKLATKRQLDQTKQRFDVGLDAITSVYNAQASYDSVVADEITAENTLANNREELRKLTGVYYPTVEGLKIELPLITPKPLDPNQWVETAERENLTLLAACYAAQEARETVKVFFGGHLPVLSANGTAALNHGQSFGQLDTKSAAIGLQLNVPLYQGGFVSSQVRQAKDDYATATAKMEDTHRQVIVTTRQKFSDTLAGIAKLKADRHAILSAQSSLDSTEESVKVGTRTIVDVLLAQKDLYNTKQNYARDEYEYLLNTLLLKQAAGTLNVADLMCINAWFKGPESKARALEKTLAPSATKYDDMDEETIPITDTEKKSSQNNTKKKTASAHAKTHTAKEDAHSATHKHPSLVHHDAAHPLQKQSHSAQLATNHEKKLAHKTQVVTHKQKEQKEV